MGVRFTEEADSGNEKRKSLEDFRTLSIQFLHYANLGISQFDFLRHVTGLLLESCGCDAVEVRAADGRLHYCGESTRRAETPFEFEIVTQPEEDEGARDGPESPPLDFDRTCRAVMSGKTHEFSRYNTDYGSLWVSDTVAARGPRPEAGVIAAVFAGAGAEGFRSILIVPFVIGDRNNGVLALKSAKPSFFTRREVSLYESIAQNLGAAIATRRIRAEYHERVKELTCLYGIAQEASRPELTLEEVLLEIVGLIPPGWQYPEITRGRIVLDGRVFSTAEFSDEWQKQEADIVIAGNKRGVVEVAYTEKRPEVAEGPFLKEERNLIDAIARQLSLIIERRKSEEDRMKLQDQLRHADRLATIGQLAAGVAHEFNEPLGNILGFAQLVLKNKDLRDEVRADIEKIVGASMHAREVVRKLMLFARQEPAKLARVDLNTVIEEGLYFLEARCAKAGIELEYRLEPELPEITADPAQIHQVLVNLVVNAIQAMPDGGTITIATKSDDDHVSLLVEDTGIGMSEEIRKQLFIPFFTTKDVDEGTGLGLPVVHGIVTSHGGSIQVWSKVGEGSRFEIRLPLKGPGGIREKTS